MSRYSHIFKLITLLPHDRIQGQNTENILVNEGGNGNPLQYSCLETSMDRGARRIIVHGAADSWTQLSTHTHTHSGKKVAEEV